MAATKWLLVALVSISYLAVVTPSSDIMKKLSIGFTKVINECREELDAGDHIIKDFENYWQEEYALLNREFGCMVMCMAGKHDMLNDGGTGIHHDSATEFAKKHGADQEVAKQVATMILDCEKQFLELSDKCLRALETSKCFRTKIHELKWAPSMEEILEEVMSEVAILVDSFSCPLRPGSVEVHI